MIDHAAEDGRPERLRVVSKPSRNCLPSPLTLPYRPAALPQPQRSSRGCSGWETRVRVQEARKVVQHIHDGRCAPGFDFGPREFAPRKA